jgi:hypothetical protein
MPGHRAFLYNLMRKYGCDFNICLELDPFTGFVIEDKNEKEQRHDSHEQSYRNPFFEVCINQYE